MPFWAPIVLAYTNDILRVGFEALKLEHSTIYINDVKYGMEILSPSNLPWSHGLFMSVVWSLLVGIIIYILRHDRRTAIIMSMVVMSHWFLDFIVHPPELPLLFGNSPKVGLGLSTTPQGLRIEFIIEGVMMLSGLILYFIYLKRRITPPVKNV